MATAVKTWTWDASTESFTLTAGADSTFVRDTAQGSPNNGSLRHVTTGRNKVGTSNAMLTGVTWETLGVPSGSTVTHVQVTDIRTYRGLTSWNGADATRVTAYLRANSTTTEVTGSSLFERTGTTQDGSWQTGSGTNQSVNASYQASDTSLDVRIEVYVDLPNTPNSSSVHVDYLQFTITYDPPAQPTATGALTLPAATISGAATATNPTPTDTAYTDLVQSFSPRAYLPHDDYSGNLRDASGNSFPGTAVGTLSYRQTGPTIDSVAQSAIDYADVGNAYVSATVDDNVTDAFTISVWFKVPASSVTEDILNQYGTAGQYSWRLLLDSSGYPYFYLYSASDAPIAYPGEATACDDGSWHHVVAWRTSDGVAHLILDGGTERTHGPLGTWRGATAATLNVAALTSGGSSRANVAVAHVAYWDSVLTSDQRGSLYTGQTASGYSATGAATLPAATISGTASRTEHFSATGSLTGQPATIAGSGSAIEHYTSTGAATLPAAILAGQADYGVEATGALTGEPIAIVGAATLTEHFSASGSLTLPAASIAGAADYGIEATGALDLASLTIAGDATATQAIAATGSLTFEPATLTGSATYTERYSSTGALTLPTATISATADYGIEATGAVTLTSVTVSGDATYSQGYTGTGSLTAQPATIAGDASYGVSSTGSLTLSAVEVSGAGQYVLDVTATGTVTTEPVTLTGSGAYGNARVGTGAITAPAAQISADGSYGVSATGTAQTPSTTLTGDATYTPPAYTATGAVVTVAPTLDGTGAFAISGTGTVTTPAATIAGTGTHAEGIEGTGSVSLPGISLAGDGSMVAAYSATGSLTLPAIVVDGAEVIPTPGGATHPPRPWPYRPQPKVIYRPAFSGDGAISLPAMRASGTGGMSDDEIVLGLLLGIDM